ncbi:hypothetical protein HHK36_022182 [Tetracentron sinense]|uniref:Uncharacterized protein n=1 Tax=Tetracentron sinense TaxID=13715 RepID=A0A834YMJ8_TETSI|nr:hypothetical protein HHK36_022182 [Tetracentron sinense]
MEGMDVLLAYGRSCNGSHGDSRNRFVSDVTPAIGLQLQYQALGLPIEGSSVRTSLQKFQPSKATLSPSLPIPWSTRSRDPQLGKSIGATTALEVRATGIPFVFASCIAVAACANHFVDDGGTTKGINENNTVIDRPGLLCIHLLAYYNSIIKGVNCHGLILKLEWEKMHSNHNLVTRFLKDTLNFRGIDMIISLPHSNYTYSVLAGIQAGIDMVSACL